MQRRWKNCVVLELTECYTIYINNITTLILFCIHLDYMLTINVIVIVYKCFNNTI